MARDDAFGSSCRRSRVALRLRPILKRASHSRPALPSGTVRLPPAVSRATTDEILRSHGAKPPTRCYVCDLPSFCRERQQRYRTSSGVRDRIVPSLRPNLRGSGLAITGYGAKFGTPSASGRSERRKDKVSTPRSSAVVRPPRTGSSRFRVREPPHGRVAVGRRPAVETTSTWQRPARAHRWWSSRGPSSAFVPQAGTRRSRFPLVWRQGNGIYVSSSRRRHPASRSPSNPRSCRGATRWHPDPGPVGRRS